MRAAEQLDQPLAGASAGPASNGDTDSDCDCAATMHCAPCVARAPLPQRVAAIRAALAAEPEQLVAITLLLQLVPR